MKTTVIRSMATAVLILAPLFVSNSHAEASKTDIRHARNTTVTLCTSRGVVAGSGINLGGGYFVTAYHVSINNSQMQICDYDTELYNTKLTPLAHDEDNDIAILQADSQNPAVYDDNFIAKPASKPIEAGDSIIIVGAPAGYYERTVSFGHIGKTKTNLGFDVAYPVAVDMQTVTEKILQSLFGLAPERERTFKNLILLSVSINQGNSGGGIYNNNGELIGIAIIASKFLHNISFAIPVDKVAELFAKIETPVAPKPGKKIEYKIYNYGEAL